jgi:hypothetical protein
MGSIVDSIEINRRPEDVFAYIDDWVGMANGRTRS